MANFYERREKRLEDAGLSPAAEMHKRIAELERELALLNAERSKPTPSSAGAQAASDGDMGDREPRRAVNTVSARVGEPTRESGSVTPVGPFISTKGHSDSDASAEMPTRSSLPPTPASVPASGGSPLVSERETRLERKVKHLCDCLKATGNKAAMEIADSTTRALLDQTQASELAACGHPKSETIKIFGAGAPESGVDACRICNGWASGEREGRG